MGGGVGMIGMVKGAGNRSGGRPPTSKIIFDKYDKDGDGCIDAEEFKFMCMDLGHQLSDDEMKYALLKLDTTGAGKVNYEDFVEKFWSIDDRWDGLRLSDEELMELSCLLTEFQAFDADDDGTVDKEEFTSMYESLQAGGVTKDAESVFTEIDRNCDGNICFNEYVDWLKRSAVDRVALSSAAHAAATARHNEMYGAGVARDADADDLAAEVVQSR
jgi:Ca2+-binding EF-hand superfamily protein